MKSGIFVLFVLCAFAAHAFAAPQVNDYDKSYLDSVVTKGKELYEKAVQQIKDFSKNLDDRVPKIILEAEYILYTLAEKVKDEINNYQQKGFHAKKCVEKYYPELQKVKKQAEQEFQKCVDDAKNDGKSHQGHIDSAVKTIKEEVAELNKLVKECASINPVSVTKCAYQKREEFKNAIVKIGKDVQFIVEESAKHTGNIAKNAKSCTESVFKETTAKIQEIRAKGEECLKRH